MTPALMMLWACLGSMSTVHAVQLGGRTGLGYASAIGGPNGIAVVHGTSTFIIEGLFGLQYQAFDEADRDDAAFLDFGVGGHFQLLSSEAASVTVGLRFNLLTGRIEDDSQGFIQTQDLVQWGVDVPLRVYWFPDPHISIHSEFGLAFLVGPDDGVLTEGLTPRGLRINVFDGGPFAGLGLTFWWG
jgi:hypothetical protein